MMVYVPAAVDEATVIVMVEVPAPVIEVGLKLTVTPVGWPLADKEMAESKPPVTVLVMVEVPELALHHRDRSGRGGKAEARSRRASGKCVDQAGSRSDCPSRSPNRSRSLPNSRCCRW